MNTQDNLNMASKLGHTIANILGQPVSSKPDVATAVQDLIVALAAKARSLLQAGELKIEVTMGAGLDNKLMHVSSVNEIIAGADALVGSLTYNGPDCDCAFAPCEHKTKPAGLSGFSSEALHGYLRRAVVGKSAIDHVVRVVSSNEHEAEFYIRPLNTDGETIQFTVTRI